MKTELLKRLSILLAALCLAAGLCVAGCSVDFADDSGADEPAATQQEDSSSGDAVDYDPSTDEDYVDYYFRNRSRLKEHYNKHGREMGFSSMEDYELAASDVVNNPNALHKIESEDGDDVYYLEDTNEFVVVSTDGYLRTYFNPDSGKSYFDRQ